MHYSRHDSGNPNLSTNQSMEGKMQTIQHIVVPVDMEEHTEKIMEFAASFAEKFNSKMTLVHVVEPFPTGGDMELGIATIKEYTENRIQHSQKFLENLAKPYQNCEIRILQGIIDDEIVAFAKDSAADMIVIGTHGTKGIEKLLLGSVAERVVKEAHCPTLVMNPFKH